MSSSLLDRSLDDISRQTLQTRRGGGAGRSGRGRVTSEGSRASPYSKPAPRNGGAADPDGQWQHDLFKTDKLDYGGEGDDGSSAAPASTRRRDNGGNEARSTRLKITNLHYEVSEAELEALFLQVGTLAPATARETNPAIKFDISGRSMGEAYVTYESEADAARAKEVFNNALAKGERISIEYDFRGPPRPRKNDSSSSSNWQTSIPSTGFGGGNLNKSTGGSSGGNSLLARMDRAQPPPTAAGRAPYASSAGRAPPVGSGSRGSPRGAARGSASSRGGITSRGRGGAGGRSNGAGSSREAKSTEDLDRELEEFMAKGNSGNTDTSTTTATAAATEDVEMA